MCAPSTPDEPVGGALNTGGATVQDVGVDHGRGDVLVTEQLLDSTDVAAVFQEVGCEAGAEGMAGGGTCQGV